MSRSTLRKIYFLLSLGSVFGQLTISYTESGQVVCPNTSSVLACQFNGFLGSITWYYGCEINGVTNTVSVSSSLYQESEMIVCTSNGHSVMFTLSFTYSYSVPVTMSNASVIGQVSSEIPHSMSVYLRCEDPPSAIQEVQISETPPPPPTNLTYNINPQDYNFTHYQVFYVWSHPLQNTSIASVITNYIIKLEANLTRYSEIIRLENDVSNVTVWQNFDRIYNVSLYSVNCGSTMSRAQHIEVFRKAPNFSVYSVPPSYFISSMSYKVCIDSRYPIIFSWLPPPQANISFAILKGYILSIESESNMNTSLFKLNSQMSNITLWLEYNNTYNVSLQSEYDTVVGNSEPLLIEVLQNTFVTCCPLFGINSSSNCEFQYSMNGMVLQLNCSGNQVQCFCNENGEWHPNPYDYLKMFSKGIAKSTTESTEGNSTTEITTPLTRPTNHLYLIVGIFATSFLILTSVMVLALIIFIRVQISHSKRLYRCTVEESLYTDPPRNNHHNVPSFQDPEQSEHASGHGNIQYEEIGMSQRPPRGSPHHEVTGLGHQYSVLTRPSPLYSALFGYSNPTELGNMEASSSNPVGEVEKISEIHAERDNSPAARNTQVNNDSNTVEVNQEEDDEYLEIIRDDLNN